MAFTNLPPNLQDMFYNLQDQINKLVTGPNQAMYTAESAQYTAQSAQSVATDAQIQAINAGVAANNAAAQAVIAQSQATIASSQATQAQTSANGKNNIYYGTLPISSFTSATITNVSGNGTTITYTAANSFASGNKVTITGVNPSQYNLSNQTIVSATNTQFTISGTATGTYISGGSATVTRSFVAGDIYFRYSSSGIIIEQWVSTGGTSWQQQTITQAVIGNLDAGKITTGTLSAITISAGSGANSFYVSSAGVMSAQGVYVKGAIVADSGTFTGSVRANDGYFGTGSGSTITNGWSIGANGLTGVGTGTITGGAISGSTITGGIVQTSSGTTAVRMVGTSNTLDFVVGGSIVGQIYPLSTGGISFQYGNSLTNAYMYLNSNTVFLRGDSSNSLSVSNTGTSIGSSANDILLNSATGVTVNSSYPTSVVNLWSAVRVRYNGTIRYLYLEYADNTLNTTNPTQTTAAPNCFISSTGQVLKSSTTSSTRFKENITDINNVFELDPKLLLQIPVKAFTYKQGHIPETDDRAGQMLPGLLAEDVDAIYPIATDYEDGNIQTWSERYIIPGMLALIQDQEKRIKLLEGK